MEEKSLSMACRLILTKEVIQYISYFAMQVILLPKNILDKMGKKSTKFIWGHKENKTHQLYLKA